MIYIVAEKINNRDSLYFVDSNEKILQSQKDKKLITDYILRDDTKNYQVIDDKIVEK